MGLHQKIRVGESTYTDAIAVEHDHGNSDNGGTSLTPDSITVDGPLEAGETATVQISTEQTATVDRTCPDGETYVIESGESMTVAGDYEVNGELVIEPNATFAVV